MASTRRQKSKGKAWSFIAGAKGENRVRVSERRDREGFWITYRDEHGARHQQRLTVADHDQAKAKAEEIAGRFRREGARQPAALTLAGLFESYEREVTGTKSLTTQAHDRRSFELFRRSFGPERRPETLSRREWDAYITARRSGRLRPPKAKEKRVRDRIIEQDLRLLNAVLNWAAQAGDGRGGYLLERNPLKGLPVPKEQSPKRARLSPEQYELLRNAAAAISTNVECFVVLAWETGHRAASLRQLRWSDVDFEGRRLHWRGEVDKIGLDHWNPITDEAVSMLKRERARIATIGDAWIFPDPRTKRDKRELEPLSRYGAVDLWRRLAATAKLPSEERYGWHSCRRAFANRLRKAPLKDLQGLGGWKTSATVLNVYLQHDEGAQREALELHAQPAKVVGNR